MRVGGSLYKDQYANWLFSSLFMLSSSTAGFLSPLQLMKVEGHTHLLKDLNVCLLMEARARLGTWDL